MWAKDYTFLQKSGFISPKAHSPGKQKHLVAQECPKNKLNLQVALPLILEKPRQLAAGKRQLGRAKAEVWSDLAPALAGFCPLREPHSPKPPAHGDGGGN